MPSRQYHPWVVLFESKVIFPPTPSLPVHYYYHLKAFAFISASFVCLSVPVHFNSECIYRKAGKCTWCEQSCRCRIDWTIDSATMAFRPLKFRMTFQQHTNNNKNGDRNAAFCLHFITVCAHTPHHTRSFIHSFLVRINLCLFYVCSAVAMTMSVELLCRAHWLHLGCVAIVSPKKRTTRWHSVCRAPANKYLINVDDIGHGRTVRWDMCLNAWFITIIIISRQQSPHATG